MMEYENYFYKYAAAYLRGEALRTKQMYSCPIELQDKSFEELSKDELQQIMQFGKEAGIKLYPFKKSHEELPRVRKVLGFLKSLQFETLLDVGSGRGVFLFPFMDAFPWVNVTSLDL